MWVFLANQVDKDLFFYTPDKKRTLFRPEKVSFQTVQNMEIFQRD